MPEYLAPGVYAEEISTGPVPIEGVSTSVTGLVGPTPRGPVQPRLVTSWLEFQLWYGSLPDPASPYAYTMWAAQGFFANGGQLLYMARVCGGGGTSSSLALAGPSPLNVGSAGPGDLDDHIFVRVAAASNGDPTRVRITVLFYNTVPPLPLVDPLSRAQADLRNANRREPDLTEDFDGLLPTDIVPALHGSTLITGSFNGTAALPTVAGFAPLIGSAPGAAPVLNDYTGDATLSLTQRTGLAGLAGIDQISLLCVPDSPVVVDVDDELRIQCEQLRDRFAVLQLPWGEGNPGAIVPPLSSEYAAVYYPWIRVQDPVSGSGVLVPPCGHVAGIYAATDDQRGVHKAPANVTVSGILTTDLPNGQTPLEYTISQGDQEILNPLGINCFRDFRASLLGCRVWGARTLSADPQWRYINVRRLYIFVEQSVIRGTQWVVFEPNDEVTWARVERSVTEFLNGVWKSGALMGTTADQAFFVRCDRTTMTQDDIDNGRLVCLVGMAPAKPAEFVIFRFSQMTDQASS
jgi:hypothetical protein